MSDLDQIDDVDADEPVANVDGRVARRERNINAVLDVVLDLFGEEQMFPTIEQAASRSGLSLRSLYRYFADPGALLEATIQRSRERSLEVVQLHAIGEGALEPRIDDFVAMRLRLYDLIGPMYRATVANAAQLARIQDELTSTRIELSDQFVLQFAPEIAAKKRVDRAAVDAADWMMQLDSIDFLRRHRGLSVADTERTLKTTLSTLLS